MKIFTLHFQILFLVTDQAIKPMSERAIDLLLFALKLHQKTFQD